MNSLVTAENIRLDIPDRSGESRTIVARLSLEVAPRRAIALAGRSGSGKTTMLSVCSGLRDPSEGRVLWDGVPIERWSADRRARWRRDHMGILDQDSHMISDLTVMENICIPMRRPGPRPVARIQKLLAQLDVATLGAAKPSTCSGGERQRIGLARSLAADPEVLILDEPTANLDRTSAERVIAVLNDARLRGAGVLVATHDELVLDWADERVDLVPGVSTQTAGGFEFPGAGGGATVSELEPTVRPGSGF